MENKHTAVLLLEDGTVFKGKSFGAPVEKIVEVVFNTSMVGYQEILSDPSYTDQAVVMTYPLIGNYGMCDEDYETERPTIAAFIVREYCEQPSNFRASETLEEVMKRYDIAGISDIDTRKLTRHIRNAGSMKGYILQGEEVPEGSLQTLQEAIMPSDGVPRVTAKKIYDFHEGETEETSYTYHVAVIDCGIKKNILRSMQKRGILCTVVPCDTPAEVIEAMKPDGVFISNGPGDPADNVKTIETVRNLLGKCPIFGICLGHQLIALAYGAETYKLKFGHRGGNHPVKNLSTGKLEITSQNHSYAVLTESLKNTPLQVTHINLLDQTVEGMSCERDSVFSVQYHPESAPGPEDSGYLFDVFIENMKAFQEVQHA